MDIEEFFANTPSAPPERDLSARDLRRTASGGCLAVLASILLLEVLYELRVFFPLASQTAWQAFCAAVYLLAIGGAGAIYAGLTRTKLHPQQPRPALGLGAALFVILLGTAACQLANFPSTVASWLLEQVGLFSETPPPDLENSVACMAFYLCSIAVIPAVTEEILFRGLLMQKLVPYGKGLALAASAAVFGIFHGDLSQAVFAFFCGLALGAIVLKTGRIWPAMVVHFLNNALSGVYDIVEFYGGYRLAGRVYNAAFYTIIIAALVALAIFLLRRRDRLRVAPFVRARTLGRGQFWGAMLTNPGFLLLLVYCAYDMAMVFA